MTKTNELIGAELDYFAGLATESINLDIDLETFKRVNKDGFHRFSTNWQQGGPLIYKYPVCIGIHDFRRIAMAQGSHDEIIYSESMDMDVDPLPALMRCVVFSVYGDEVND